MCESNAYVRKDGIEELVMESVDYMLITDGKILLRSLFGEETTVEATLREMKLTDHKIVLESK